MYFFLISDSTIGFLDENWSGIAKNVKKSKYDLYTPYTFNIKNKNSIIFLTGPNINVSDC